jgi:putative oxidoreductase
MTISQHQTTGDLRGQSFALVDRAIAIIATVAQRDLVQFVLRVALSVPFWKSGMLKWTGFLQLSDTAVTLFSDEFMIHLPGGPYHYPAPALFAFLSGSGEIIFPVLLVVGFATRFAALGLLFMTLIVELTVPDGWPIHITWAAMALAIMAYGPGRASIDHLLRRALGAPSVTPSPMYLAMYPPLAVITVAQHL